MADREVDGDEEGRTVDADLADGDAFAISNGHF
jgi:hypothetical protein